MIKRYKPVIKYQEDYVTREEIIAPEYFVKKDTFTPVRIIKGHLIEDDLGEWVKWEDVKDLIKYDDQSVIETHIHIQPDKPWPKPEKNPKCNCAEMLERVLERENKLNNEYRMRIFPVEPTEIKKIPFEWVCPVHGYKKR